VKIHPEWVVTPGKQTNNYNSNSIQYAAVSQPDMNELAATKFPLRSANDLQTDDCTTAGRITERL
jgi:hypothetical protein